MTAANLESKIAYDVESVRADFPGLHHSVNGKPLVYLDNAATGQRPQSVLDAMDRYYSEFNASVHRGVHTMSRHATDAFEAAREKVRMFLNARSDREIVLTKGCTESINLVAASYGREFLKAGDEILLTTMEHHSNIVPWQLCAEAVGAKVRPIPIDDAGQIDMAAYEAMLGPKTEVVGIVHVSNALGTVNPVKEMIGMAHRVGAIAVIDGAQAGPHQFIDVQDLDADFYTLSCHKMFGPTGVGILYGKEALLDKMPPYQGGGSMIITVAFEKSTYADLPAKFEPGTPNIAGLIGVGAVVDYLVGLGRRLGEGGPDRQALGVAMSAIEAHEETLVRYGSEKLSEIAGLRLVGTAKHKAAILSFTMDGVHPHDIGQVLDAEGVAIRTGHHCAMPLMARLGVPATARASLALYSTKGEIDALVSALHKVGGMFA